MICEQEKEELVKEIEETRQNMVDTGLQYGFTHVDTVTLSTKLDELLNGLYKTLNRDRVEI